MLDDAVARKKDAPDKTVGYLLTLQALIQRNPTEQSYHLLDQAMCAITRTPTRHPRETFYLGASGNVFMTLCAQPGARNSFNYYLLPYAHYSLNSFPFPLGHTSKFQTPLRLKVAV